jgi:hypothetical protein
MAAALSFSLTPKVHFAFDELRATASVRAAIAELKEIGDELAKFHLNDEMSTAIQVEYDRFKGFLQKDRTVESILRCYDAFTQTLQKLLVDPIFRKPLDEDALLGTDGRAYGRKTLLIYLAGAEEIYRSRSPKNPSDPTSCTYELHPVVQYICRWVKKIKGPLAFHSKDVENEYTKLLDLGKIPEIPTELLDDIRYLLSRRSERESKRNPELERFRVAHRAELETKVQARFASVHTRREENAHILQKSLDELAKKAQLIENLKEEAKKLRVEIDELANKIPQLEEDIKKLGSRMSTAEKDMAEIDIMLKQSEKALKEREEGWVTSLLQTVAIVAVCAVLSAATSGTALPLSGGGKFGGAIAF